MSEMDLITLVEQVVEQIRKDLEDGDTTSIEEMLMHTPVEYLKGYLPEGSEN